MITKLIRNYFKKGHSLRPGSQLWWFLFIFQFDDKLWILDKTSPLVFGRMFSSILQTEQNTVNNARVRLVKKNDYLHKIWNFFILLLDIDVDVRNKFPVDATFNFILAQE